MAYKPENAMLRRFGWLVMILLSVIGVSSTTMAEKLIWVTVEEKTLMRPGEEQNVRSKALAAAERKAVAEALATGISIKTLLVNLMLGGSSFAETIPYGKVAKKKILEEGPVDNKGVKSTQEGKFYRVKIKAGVVRETGGKDPAFNLYTTLNKSDFKDGDELKIHVRSTKDCYLAIYNILEDKKIIRLLPNYLSIKNFLPANENLIFPGGEKDSKGPQLRLHLPKKKEEVQEFIYILALTHPFELKSVNAQEGIYGNYNGQTASMKDLVRQVVSIPLSRRAETLVQYRIRKKK